MEQTLSIALLAQKRGPLCGYIYQALQTQGLKVNAIIIDAKEVTEKTFRIWQERTDGRLPPIDIRSLAQEETLIAEVESHNSQATVDLIKSCKIDLLINAGTPRTVETPLLLAPAVGVLNVHPGLLPQFRGATCVEWAIYLDEPVGNTVHFMTEGIDEGPIVMKERCRINRDDRYVDIRTKVYRHGFDLLSRSVWRIIGDGIRPHLLPPQEQGQRFYPIEDEKMTVVINKLNNGRYRWQAED